MSIIDRILGRSDKSGGANEEMIMGADPYGQYSQMIDPNAMALMNAPNRTSRDMAEFTTSNEEPIEKFKEGLRGLRQYKSYNIHTGQTEIKSEKFGEPALNDEGINELGRDLDMYLSKPFILSNIPKEDKKRIDAMMKIIWKRISSKLIVNAKKYHLDKSRRPSIVAEMMMMIYLNTLRSYNDGERPLMYNTHKTLQTISSNNTPQMAPQPKKWGLF